MMAPIVMKSSTEFKKLDLMNTAYYKLQTIFLNTISLND